MLKLRESLSFSVEFIRIDKSTNFDTSDNMSVDLSLRSKWLENSRKSVSIVQAVGGEGIKF